MNIIRSFYLLVTTATLSFVVDTKASEYVFTEPDIQFLQQFSLDHLNALPATESNRHGDDIHAAELGRRLFFDPRMSANNRISCASCHQPEKYFTDGLKRSVALGQTRRNAPSVLGAAYSPWLFWDGRADSLWSQALIPLEDPEEHGLSRVQVAARVARYYKEAYESIFNQTLPPPDYWQKIPAVASPLGSPVQKQQWQNMQSVDQDRVNRVFSNVGKALMAYQRRLALPPSRFDRFLEQLGDKNSADAPEALTLDEVKGLRLFVGKGNCASCHNGPLFTNFEFHNIGAPEPDREQVDMGRAEGVAQLINDEFTCLSPWSDADAAGCEEMLYLKQSGQELIGAFKTPGLRNIAQTAPYMQAGQFDTLRQVLDHYNLPNPPFYDPEQHPSRPHFDILPLQLTEEEILQLIAFLKTLTSPFPEHDIWWQDPFGNRQLSVRQ